MKAVIRAEFEYCKYMLYGRTLIDYVKQAASEANLEAVIVSGIAGFQPDEAEDYLVIPGDMPLITAKTLQRLTELYKYGGGSPVAIGNNGAATVLAVSGTLLGQGDINEVRTSSCDELIRVDSAARYAEVVTSMRSRINGIHMEKGVIITDPHRTDIDASVVIGRGTVIYPGCFLEGETKIGYNCVIGPGTRLSSSVVGEGTEIMYSVVVESRIGMSALIGPYTYVRPGSVIGDKCRIGDFVEIKNSIIGAHTKISHLTYVGDSDVGEGVNFGCGSVTANYDGKAKHRTKIGNGAFIGCNTNLVAPVSIGENAFTAAGSTINMDVPDNSLGIARARQENKPDWALRRV